MSEWATLTLENMVDVLDNRRVPLNEEQRASMPGNIPYYGANGVQGYINKAIYSEPLILMAEDGGNFDEFAQRPIAYRIDGPSWVNNHAHVLKAKPGFHQDFIFYNLEHKDIRQFIKGGTRAKLNAGDLKDILITYPTDENEQRGIAEVLSALDEQIEAVEQEKAKLTQVLIGAFDETFGQALQAGVTSAGLKSGALTVGWSRVPVLEAASDILDFRGRTPLKIGMTWGGGNIPALSANNVQMGLVNFEKESYLGSDALYTKWMTQGKCAKNDVLMTLEAPLGNIALVPDDRKYILSQRVILLKPNKELMDGRYLSLYLRWRWFQQLLSEESTGTTAAGIQRKKLEKLPVLVAPPGMRDGITDFLFSLVTQVDDFEAEAAKLRLQKQGLMRDLLTGKVRVH